MAIRSILKMGDPLLLRDSIPIDINLIPSTEIQTLIDDMVETMHSRNGAGLAAPQLGVNQQIVVFGFEKNPRYPDAEPIEQTILINPIITVMDKQEEEDWEGCLSVPGIRAKVPRYKKKFVIKVTIVLGNLLIEQWMDFMRAWYSMNVITSLVRFFRCA
jgi:peptide deformylase